MKVIKLTESDLEQIVKKVLDEQFVNAISSLKPVASGVKGVQQALINKGYNVGSDGADGVMGPNTKNAIMKYQKDNGIKQTGNVGPVTAKSLGVEPLISGKPTTSEKKSPKSIPSKNKTNGGFILIWAFPSYEPKIDGGGIAHVFGSIVRVASGGGKEGTYGKWGHGGCVIIQPNGESTCYEFGRYPGHKKGWGKVLTHPLGKVAKISNGVLTNPQQIARIAKSKTFPPGPTMDMSVAVVKLPNPSSAIDFASKKEREYSVLDFFIGDEANCGTFARDVAHAGGVPVGSFCFPSPISVVNSFRDQADKMFSV